MVQSEEESEEPSEESMSYMWMMAIVEQGSSFMGATYQPRCMYASARFSVDVSLCPAS